MKTDEEYRSLQKLNSVADKDLRPPTSLLLLGRDTLIALHILGDPNGSGDARGGVASLNDTVDLGQSGTPASD